MPGNEFSHSVSVPQVHGRGRFGLTYRGFFFRFFRPRVSGPRPYWNSHGAHELRVTVG
jgi:hypothetical protein